MTITEEILTEITHSRQKHGNFAGSHEGYAVIAEELDELWDLVKRKDRPFLSMRRECIQIAAMAIKFAEDICEKQNDR